ncbi:hypothetical protein FACS1894164_20890 [Spirochaetia bacterium]|nr:hypothetical protein FACS1894164_20890 [Spirochaetia bacterium]
MRKNVCFMVLLILSTITYVFAGGTAAPDERMIAEGIRHSFNDEQLKTVDYYIDEDITLSRESSADEKITISRKTLGKLIQIKIININEKAVKCLGICFESSDADVDKLLWLAPGVYKENFPNGYYLITSEVLSGTQNYGGILEYGDEKYVKISTGTSWTYLLAENFPAGVPPDEDFEVIQNKDGITLTISKYKGTLKDIIIPEIFYGLPVTVIGGRAFMGKNLTSIVIPKSITTIESYVVQGFGTAQDTGAFENNKLTSIIIPDSVTSIGVRVFANNQLTSITISNSITTIGEGAFAKNQLTNVILGRGLNRIGRDAFSDNQLTSITIAKDVANGDVYYGFYAIGTVTGFEENFVNFYIGQNRTPGTYVKNGPIWSKK